MIGNDVVDLEDAGEPSPRFVERVLAPAERPRATTAAGVWRLWAAKEAAYKLWARAYPGLIFAHASFVVDPRAGVVRHPLGEVPVRWEAHGSAVTCVAWQGEPEMVTATATRAEDDDPSVTVRLLCKRLLSERLGIDDVEIVRPAGGPPQAHRRGRPVEGLTISLSHDGRYLACAAARTKPLRAA